ncbi:SDR family oxidoreductase [Sulfuriroseicoccus oceanibius]|uniref:SDR family oxidoreductase n=1 Tax=Sulfuriroseicoccus oceanibius TaxID=2707525 RepID=A0A6B3L7P9_9BACT|nr:SDR family oxidoreductase [Sulfuriroseicoccus oceanibius]QQL45484.1 SDR family oxidoreductase [Sulfuriroseicoccus oceanibius]
MTILITGASSGIGRALALALVDRGETVLGVSRDTSRLPKGVTGIRADLTRDNAADKIFAKAPPIDVLVNCAGKAWLSPISSGDPNQWDEMWKINVRSLATCCQAFLKQEGRASGTIINVSSMSGWRVPPSGGFYSPTKFAVRAITEALRGELRATGSPVRVGSISPGFVDTPLLNDYFHGREAQLADQRASIKMLSPEDVAHAIIQMIDAPAHVEIGDIQMRSIDQKA